MFIITDDMICSMCLVILLTLLLKMQKRKEKNYKINKNKKRSKQKQKQKQKKEHRKKVKRINSKGTVNYVKSYKEYIISFLLLLIILKKCLSYLQ